MVEGISNGKDRSIKALWKVVYGLQRSLDKRKDHNIQDVGMLSNEQHELKKFILEKNADTLKWAIGLMIGLATWLTTLLIAQGTLLVMFLHKP